MAGICGSIFHLHTTLHLVYKRCTFLLWLSLAADCACSWVKSLLNLAITSSCIGQTHTHVNIGYTQIYISDTTTVSLIPVLELLECLQMYNYRSIDCLHTLLLSISLLCTSIAALWLFLSSSTLWRCVCSIFSLSVSAWALDSSFSSKNCSLSEALCARTLANSFSRETSSFFIWSNIPLVCCST